MLVLGVDAAWTSNNPSGLALVRWRNDYLPELLAVARSYEEFFCTSQNFSIDWEAKVKGTTPNFEQIVNHAEKTFGERLLIISLDIPLSPRPILDRRVADNEISKLYGGKGAAAHTPNAKRPGEISKTIFNTLSALGYKWASQSGDNVSEGTPLFFETYPHPAIINMLNLDYRLPYKVSKRSKYWPDKCPLERKRLLTDEMEKLRQGLSKNIQGVTKILTPSRSLINYPVWMIQDYENIMDALVCAWVGCDFLSGKVNVYGDSKSAIWLPNKV